MKKTVILKGPDNFDYAWDLIQEVGSQDEIHEIEIRPYKSKLSSNQRRLYWMWLREISKKTGYTEDELHLRYKKNYLVKIFERDDKEYALMIDHVRDVHRMGKPGMAKHFEAQIIKLTSITDADTAQMSEYLDCINQEAITKLQLQLPIPEDIGRYQPN